jgi:site-specific DNA-methyltransferase (adenine-specific)/site-specific DNA-methyltransferase (cytosine-N4-specific)
VPIDSVVLDPSNAMEHPIENLAAIRGSLAKYGQRKPIVVNRAGNIIEAGNGTWQAAKALGWTHIAAVFVEDDPSTAVGYAIADNRTAQLATWNYDILAQILQEGVEDPLNIPGVDAAFMSTVLDTLEMDADTRDDPEPPVDQAEALCQQWGVEPGQVWRLGAHYVICGDCRESETWERLLDTADVGAVQGVFTSPPYAEQRKEQYGGVPADEYVAWWEAVQANVRAHLAIDGSFFVNIKAHCENGERVLYVMDLVLAMKRRWGWRFIDELCWTHQGIMGWWKERLKNQFEPIYQFSVTQTPVRHANIVKDFEQQATAEYETYNGPNYTPSTGSPFKAQKKRSAAFDGALPGNTLRIGIGGGGIVPGQPAQFPVALPDFFIRAYSDEGDTWLDPFLGSGTTIIAAHQNERRGLGIERVPKYVAVTIQRWVDLTGGEPVLVNTQRGEEDDRERAD